MGGTKEEMKPSTSGCKTENMADKVANKGAGVLGFDRLIGRNKKGKKETVEQAAETFVDLIQEAKKRIELLITNKEVELNKESGRETYNTRALMRLQAMERNLEDILDTAQEYGEDKGN